MGVVRTARLHALLQSSVLDPALRPASRNELLEEWSFDDRADRLSARIERSFAVGETTHGTWVATTFIKPKSPSKKRRTFDSVAFEHMPGVQGRFVGLLPGKENDGGSLH